MPEAEGKEAVAEGVAARERERREEGSRFSPEWTESQPNGLSISTVWEVLQQARLDQGIDLDTVAARTKINAKYLQAIEAGDRESLPGGFFYKSFAHQYAQFLGVDTSAIDAEIDSALSADAPLPLPNVVKQPTVEVGSRSDTPSWSPKKYLAYAALLLVLV